MWFYVVLPFDKLLILREVVKYKKFIPSPPNEIIAIYDNWSTGNNILSNSFDVTQIDKMYMNGVEITPTYNPDYLNNPVKYVMKNTFNNCNKMFQSCNSLTSLDVSSFDTAKVTNMGYMFNNCTSLVSLDLSSFDTANVTDMSNMFSGCESLTSLDVSSFDITNVIYMNSMFNNCQSLTSLDVSSFDTSKVTNMRYMFDNCSSLTSLDLSSFDTSKVTNMYYMFGYCQSLTDLNPFYNWKQGDIDLSDSPITPLAVHQLIERSMNASDGAIARTLTLHSTTKTNWQNSEYYNEDLALLQVKNITIA